MGPAGLLDESKTAPAVPRDCLWAARRLPDPSFCHRADAGRRWGRAVLTGRAGADARRMGPHDPVSVATGPAGGTGDPELHRDVDHDGRLHRLRHPADDADTGLDPVLAAHPGQFRARPGNAMDAGGVPWHLLL